MSFMTPMIEVGATAPIATSIFSGMPWYAWVAIAWFVSDLIQKGMRSRRDENIARVEADMKLQLAKEIQDPVLVERLLKSRIRVGPDGSWESDDEDAEQAATKAASVARAVQIAVSERTDPALRAGRTVLGGLILFLMGGAFVLAAQPFCAGIPALWIPGLILGAIGLALLTFATMQRDINRHLGIEAHEVEPQEGT